MSDTTKPKSMLDQIDGGEVTGSDAPGETEAPKAVKVSKNAKAAASSLNDALEAVHPAPPKASGKTLEELVAVMLRREGREALEEENRLITQQTKQKQREHNAKDHDSKILLKQARCKHLKGGKTRIKTQQIDYAVAAHVFVNAVVYIRCLVCGARWYREDTSEYLVRRGHKISNHTHIGWREAVQMTLQSSNTQTKSEMIAFAHGTQETPSNRLDSTGLPVNLQFVDLEGKPVEGVEL